jgi:hypothetical protein
VAFIAYGFLRQQQQEAALSEGRFVPFGRTAALGFTLAGIVLGAATVIVVLA